MEITLEKIELVKDRTGVSYKEAKEALEAAEGSVVDAIIAIEDSRYYEHNGFDISRFVKAMLEKEGYPAPKFSVDKSITDFYAFTPDSFKLEGYQSHPVGGKIPVAV